MDESSHIDDVARNYVRDLRRSMAPFKSQLFIRSVWWKVQCGLDSTELDLK